MSKTLIFLDDERYPEDVTWVKYPTYDWGWVCCWGDAFMAEFYNQLKDKHLSELILSFDHDLQDFDDGGSETTGFDVLKEVVEHLLNIKACKDDLPTVYFHTMNPVGKKNMESYWNNFVKSLEE